MNKVQFSIIENYMLSCMRDSAHDNEHIYRVLYNALTIAKSEHNVNYDVLIASCMLHDIARDEQFSNPEICHAARGGEKAFHFLIGHGYSTDFAEKVKHCIQTHRFRKNNEPESIEAKILFDADKLDVAGAIGIARTLMYKGIVSEPIYTVMPNGIVSDGTNDTLPSFFQEYKYKLENLYSKFYTRSGKELALKRKNTAVRFYENLLQEVGEMYDRGHDELWRVIDM